MLKSEIRNSKSEGSSNIDKEKLYDPDDGELNGWIRRNNEMQEITNMNGWISPRLKVRFESSSELQLFGPDGKPFATYVELAARADRLEARTERLAAQLRALGVEPEV